MDGANGWLMVHTMNEMFLKSRITQLVLMNRCYISGFLGTIVVLACIVGLTGTAVALAPIQGEYDPMNPLQFMLACCQWELMKKIELTLLGQAPDERFYTPELAALDYIPPGWEFGRPVSNAPQVASYEASTSCCGQYERAQAQADVNIAWVGAQYEAWKAAQAADQAASQAEDEQASNTDEPLTDTESLDFDETALHAEQFLTTNETETQIKVQQTPVLLVAYAHDTDAGDDAHINSKQNVDEKVCEACAEAQQFAEWLFSQPKPVTTSVSH